MLIIAIILIVIAIQYARAMRIPKQSIVAFVGTLGSGKTYIAVIKALSAYRLQNMKNKIYKIFASLPKAKKVFKSWQYSATFYSNIPIKIGKNKDGSPKLCEVLTKEHLLERGLLPEKCVVLIDEIGALASQWDFDNPYVLENLEKTIRFFRHWTDGKMYVTDQVATNIVKPIRSRLGMIYNLHDFRRWLGFTPFFKVTVVPLLLVEDSASNTIESNTELEEYYFFGSLPYLRSRNRYQTRCYKPIYRTSALRKIKKFNDDLYTRYLIDISVSKAVSKDYQQNKEKYKEYIYEDISQPQKTDIDDIDVSKIDL